MANMLSPATLRVMRSAMSGERQYTDEELNACAEYMTIFFQLVNEIPVFLPEKEQISYFANVIGCFVIPSMVNSGMLNPKLIPAQPGSDDSLSANAEMVERNSRAIRSSSGDGQEDEDFVVVSKKSVN